MGTSKKPPHGELPMTNIIYCVDKPCDTQSITAVCRLVTDICHVRNFARVPFFKEPRYIIFLLVVEKSDSCECHSNIVLVAGFDNIIVTDRTAGLCNILNA